MTFKILVAALLVCFTGGVATIDAAEAQSSYTTMPLGGGMYSTTAPNGDIYTTMPLGGGMSTTAGPNGWSSTTMPLGGGMSTTTINPGFGSSAFGNPYR